MKATNRPNAELIPKVREVYFHHFNYLTEVCQIVEFDWKYDVKSEDNLNTDSLACTPIFGYSSKEPLFYKLSFGQRNLKL